MTKSYQSTLRDNNQSPMDWPKEYCLIKRIRFIFAVYLMTACITSMAEDTELYIGNSGSDARPKVLVIFDTSGSMNDRANSTSTKFEVAQTVVKNIISTNSDVDFGLAMFNYNNPDIGLDFGGGRIISKINENMTDVQRSALLAQVDALPGTRGTPLCETLFEAYRYLAGLGVFFANRDPNATPARDTSAENSTTGNYISPVGECSEIYIILMTDGEASRDQDADTEIDALPNIGPVSGNRLDELAGWLYNNDIDQDSSNGIQRAVTYTIGFQTDQALLQSTATKGGGQYFTAQTAEGLQDAFQLTLNEIRETSVTFTAPSIAINSFNRSRSLNDVYIAMFEPSNKPRWFGNLKKLGINAAGQLVDAAGALAIDPESGSIRESARTKWSSTNSADGREVQQGGAGALLAARNPATRVIKTNTGSLGALNDFNKDNDLLNMDTFGAGDNAEKDSLIDWARGIDVDDEDGDGDITDTRPWILGDPIHSRPLVINYGARGAYTTEAPDIRILMGTNHGVLHMFSGDNGQEDWAFMPKELLPITKTVRDNNSSINHQYGIDGSAVAYVKDHNNDGTINGDDKVYIFFGLRRGGKAYYALDVSNPDDPKFMWRIDKSNPVFSELGQSWSTPVITEIPDTSGPVMIIGGGYDVNKDDSGVGPGDDEGRGIFIVNAENGSLIWSVTPSDSSNIQEAGLTDSIPAPVSLIDSNGDQKTDRLYVGDTGGNLWRIDMPGEDKPNWSIFKLASLGGASGNDRRFFNQADIVSTRDGSLAFDGILLGSGNRANPNEVLVDNNFYMIRDLGIFTKTHDDSNTPPPITHASLYDATANTLQNDTDGTELTGLLSESGWHIALERGGEKNLSPSVTLDGTVFFTTLAPDNTSSCTPNPGAAYLYGVNLQRGTAVRNWNNPDATTFTKADRQTGIGNRLPDSVTPYFGGDKVSIIGIGQGEDGGGSTKVGDPLLTTGTYWYQQAD